MCQVFIPWEKSLTIIEIWSALGKLKLYVHDSSDLTDNSLVAISSHTLGWSLRVKFLYCIRFSQHYMKTWPPLFERWITLSTG